MKISVFWGCRILTSQYAYEMSVREAFPKLDIELVDLSEANCCGDPVKSMNEAAADYLAARILALANATGLDNLLIPCNRCHFAISEARKALEKDRQLSQKISGLLKEEELEYDPKIKIWHVIDLLHDFVGLEKIKRAVQKPLKGLKLATHVGCQIIRYTDLGRVDDAENPRRLDELIEALRAETVDYAEKLDCCGAAVMYSHPDSALSLAGTKMSAVQNLAVDGLVVSCPDCGLMFDSKQKDAATTIGAKLNLPVIYYTQLLGLALNIEPKKLGFMLNQSPVDQLL
ncbi:MAG: CoB--CoM heterodisulfide reductase iron-sulfur subunit B family protein, partial [Candidatus Bathycorpusculaceae bacterium]